jgi:hypothetical protein
MAFFEITSRDLFSIATNIGLNFHQTFSIQVRSFQRSTLL